jgi:GNAT superfamily N-acetyltransferase
LLDEPRIEDRLFVCFAHVPNWKAKKLVKDVENWTRARLKDVEQFCYLAYMNGKPAGFLEFLPMEQVQKYRLNPCRLAPMAGKDVEYTGKTLVALPYPNPVFNRDVFIACLWVPFSFTRKGIGSGLIKRLIHDLQEENVLSSFNVKGLQVYIENRKPSWPPGIDWPAGSATFYEKMGFMKIMDVETSEMKGCVMRKALKV